MNAARRKRKTGSLASLSSVFAPFRNSAGRQALVILAMAAALPVGAIYAWQRWGDRITEGPEYVLLPENIEITTERPDWIKSDIQEEVIRNGSLTDLSILDTQLTVKVAQAFAMHSWVEEVTRVTKHYPARVVVEMVYRKPVAMVQVSVNGQPGLLPIDINGVLLPPADFTADQTREYLRIHVPNTTPAGPVGTAWGDSHVAGAARIAAVLEKHWKTLGLYRIAINRADSASGSSPAQTYDLFTKNGVRVTWGAAPAVDSMVEAKAALGKVARLANYVKANGPLESMTETTDIDLSGTPTSDPHTALLPRPSRGANATNH